MPPRLRALVERVKRHPLWEGLADDTGAVVRHLDDLDELYLSRVPRNRGMLYGAAANYDLHVDGVFAFPAVRMYRVLVGLTENVHVETQFPGLGVAARIGRGDFVAFDFDRARHRVANLPGAPEDGHRILLKLHFCVSPAGRLAAAYAWGAHRAYVVYEALTRRVMALGTEPQTVPQFAAGLLGQFAVRHPRLVLASSAVPLVASGCALAGAARAAGVAAAAATGLVIAWIAAAWWQWSHYRSASARAVQARE